MFDFLNSWMQAGGWLVAGVLVVVGFVLLIYGADWLVAGASGVAKRFQVSNLVIGLTVVAMGTSTPEFVVNMVSVNDGTTDLAITNILGSNILNVFLILGSTALLCPICSQATSRKVDIPLASLAGIMVLLFGIFSDGIMRWGGILLLIIFVLYMAYTLRHAKDYTDENNDIQPMNIGKAVALILLGLVGLVVGGEMIVKSAVHIATAAGVSESIIGLTIVALGTSLPELATSLMAAAKKNSDIALGNVIGSNIFNVFMILGCSATIAPLPAYKGFVLDSVMAALGCLLVWLFVMTNKKHEIRWWHGAILLLIYVVYMGYRLMNA
ncbi:MAG: calcium/sodium antiporter [Paludibacteraceae bacterium]|nr:calcium/sodium antiporter [Bacteroidales bacterium]MDY4148157.1 calcium/sodium antiporter [Paludibacteraceae bacterium]